MRPGSSDLARLGHRFNEADPDGLPDNWTSGPAPRLSPDQKTELAVIVEAGPDREVDGVVRWRRIDLKRVIAERFSVDNHERHVVTLLKKISFSHMSPRPRHPGQDFEIIAAFKKKRLARVGRDVPKVAPTKIWFQMLSGRTEPILWQPRIEAMELPPCKRLTPLILLSSLLSNSAHQRDSSPPACQGQEKPRLHRIDGATRPPCRL